MIGKRILGIVFLLIGLSGLALSVGGTLIGRQVLNEVSTGLDQVLGLTIDTLDTVVDTLIVTKDTVGSINDGMETASTTAISLSTTISETRPLLTQVAQVTSEDVPDGIESVEAAIPDVAEAAGAIDDALRILSAFQIDQRIFGIPISFDLGIDYDPQKPLDETVTTLGQSLEGLPENLRQLQVHLDVADANLIVIGDNIESIAADLSSISDSAAQIEPLIDDYIGIVTETGDLVRQTRVSIDDQMEMAELILTLLFAWIGLNQVVPLYLAATLFTARSDSEEDEERAAEKDELEEDDERPAADEE